MGSLIIQLTGKVVQSNFESYKSRLIARIRSVGDLLRTEEDFRRAEDHVTFFKRAELSLKEAKQSAIDQTVDIRALFAAIDEVAAETRRVRLSLERQIRQHRTMERENLIEQELQDFSRYIDSFPVQMHALEFRALMRRELLDRAAFEAAIRGKTLAGARAALQRSRGPLIATLDRRRTEFEANARRLANLEPEERCLFQDRPGLLGLEPTALETIIRQRLLELEHQRSRATVAHRLRESTGRLVLHVEAAPSRLPEIERELTLRLDALDCTYRVEQPGPRAVELAA